MKKLKKKCKGMTLAEIIVSLAVLSVLTLLLVQVSASINTYLRSANNVNSRVCRQAPAAEVGYTIAAKSIDPDVTITVEYGSNKIEIEGEAYIVEDPSNVRSIGDADYRHGDHLAMKFIEFKPDPTEPST